MSVNHSSYSRDTGFNDVALSCVVCSPQSGVARLKLSGELDLASAPSLGEAMSNLDHAEVILDLSEVTFMDSSGLHTILAAHDRLSNANRRLVVHAGTPSVRRVFELTGTDRVLEFADAPDAGARQSSNGLRQNGAAMRGSYAMGPSLRDKLLRRPK